MRKAIGLLALLCFLLSATWCFGATQTVELLKDRVFTRGTGSPFTEAITFAGLAGKAVIKLTNGDAGSKKADNRVSSAEVSVNGTVVFGASSFNQNVGYLEKAINLRDGQNTLSVSLKSKPGSKIIITIVQQVSADAAGVVGPGGGVIEISDPGSILFGVKLEIPEGALNKAEIIRINVAQLSFPTPTWVQHVSTVLDLGPEGLQFNEKITLTIPYKENELDENQDIFIMYFNENKNEWMDLGSCVVDRVMNRGSITINHLSKYAIMSSRLDWDTNLSIGWLYPKDNLMQNPTQGLCKGISSFSAWYFMNKRQIPVNCAYPDSIKNFIAYDATYALYFSWIWSLIPENPDDLAAFLLRSLNSGNPALLEMKNSYNNTHMVVVTEWVNTGSTDSVINGYFNIWDNDALMNNPNKLVYSKNGSQKGTLDYWPPHATPRSKYDYIEFQSIVIGAIEEFILQAVYNDGERALASYQPPWDRTTCTRGYSPCASIAGFWNFSRTGPPPYGDTLTWVSTVQSDGTFHDTTGDWGCSYLNGNVVRIEFGCSPSSRTTYSGTLDNTCTHITNGIMYTPADGWLPGDQYYWSANKQ